jgi:hypothetical protein
MLLFTQAHAEADSFVVTDRRSELLGMNGFARTTVQSLMTV